eukprot:1154472-Pelagomonas_calceolata.AAC.6
MTAAQITNAASKGSERERWLCPPGFTKDLQEQPSVKTNDGKAQALRGGCKQEHRLCPPRGSQEKSSVKAHDC